MRIRSDVCISSACFVYLESSLITLVDAIFHPILPSEALIFQYMRATETAKSRSRSKNSPQKLIIMKLPISTAVLLPITTFLISVMAYIGQPYVKTTSIYPRESRISFYCPSSNNPEPSLNFPIFRSQDKGSHLPNTPFLGPQCQLKAPF